MANKSTAVKLTLKVTSFILRLLLNIIFYILVVLLIVNVSKMAFEFTYQLYGPDTVDAPGTGTPILFQIKKGESSMDIASKLDNSQAIENKYSFYIKTKLEDQVIMPGTYEISTDMTYDEILAVITNYSASIIKDEETDTGVNPATESGTGTESVTGSDADTTDTDADTTDTDDDTTDTDADSATDED